MRVDPVGRRWRGVVALAVALAACGHDVTGVAGITVYDVSVSESARAPTVEGPNLTFRIVNHGAATAYLQECGDFPALEIERYANGQWQPLLGALCPRPRTPGPIALAPGAALTLDRIFSDTGRYRVSVVVATTPDLGGSAQAVSPPFDVR